MTDKLISNKLILDYFIGITINISPKSGNHDIIFLSCYLDNSFMSILCKSNVMTKI